MNRFLLLAAVLLLSLSACGDKKTYVEIQTEFGNMKVMLYDETPQHRDNFIKLVKEGFYDDLLFHRIIPKFMIQGGDPDSRDAAPGQMLGQGGPGYTIPQEIGFPHFKGALSAARLSDNMNPEKASSGSQFYIVQGEKQNAQFLDMIERQKKFKYTPEQRKVYQEEGGYPSLDGEYTVFGEVVEGFDVIDKIAASPRNQFDRPDSDVKMKIVMSN
ncbi:MAG: peptidylprolyl isomerase [Bacteroidota bacterium]